MSGLVVVVLCVGCFFGGGCFVVCLLFVFSVTYLFRVGCFCAGIWYALVGVGWVCLLLIELLFLCLCWLVVFVRPVFICMCGLLIDSICCCVGSWLVNALDWFRCLRFFCGFGLVVCFML